MIERIRTRKARDIGKFYDKVYKSGGYFSDEKFNRMALNFLGLYKKSNVRLLDIACGQGTLLAMAEKYAETYGIDISKEAVRKAKSIARHTKFGVSSAEALPFKEKFFDYVTCMGSLEHFPDIHKSLDEMRRVSKNNAKVLIHVPNSRYLVHTALGVDTQGQINERLATESEWRKIIGEYFNIGKVYRYNTRWFLKWIPKRYCCHFTFLCTKKQN